MVRYVELDAVLAEIENLLDKSTYLEEYDCAYRDGNNGALYALKGKINSLKAKEVDLGKEIEKCLKRHNMLAVGKKDFTDIAKYFFELGLLASNPITATDRGTAEEIIINLKRVEEDYRIDLTREIEWLRNRVKKEE